MNNQLHLDGIITDLRWIGFDMGDSLSDDIYALKEEIGEDKIRERLGETGDAADDESFAFYRKLISIAVDENKYEYIRSLLQYYFNADLGDPEPFNNGFFYTNLSAEYLCRNDAAFGCSVEEELKSLIKSCEDFYPEIVPHIKDTLDTLLTVPKNLGALAYHIAHEYWRIIDNPFAGSVKSNDFWTVGYPMINRNPSYMYKCQQDIRHGEETIMHYASGDRAVTVENYVTARFSVKDNELYVDFTIGEKSIMKDAVNGNCVCVSSSPEYLEKPVPDSSYKVNRDGDCVKEFADHFSDAIKKAVEVLQAEEEIRNSL